MMLKSDDALSLTHSLSKCTLFDGLNFGVLINAHSLRAMDLRSRLYENNLTNAHDPDAKYGVKCNK